MDARGGRVKPAKPRPQQWMDFSIGRTDFWLASTLSTSKGWIRVELCLGGQDAKKHYQLLFQEKDQIEEEIGEELLWHELPKRKQSRIRRTKDDVDPRDHAQWPAQHEWLWAKLQAFHRTFSQRVKQLRADDSSPEEEEA